MKLIISKTAGFCFGVKRAVKLAFSTDAKKQTYTLGEIIHNDHVINQLTKQGIVALTEEELSTRKVERLIIRAHGVGESIYTQAKNYGVEIIDATCPYVRKIHKIVKDYSEKGCGIIIVGDIKHPEVIGIKGWVKDEVHVIKGPDDTIINSLKIDKKYIVVAQTTYKRNVVDQTLKQLVEKGYDVEYISTICDATTDRQSDAEKISKQVEAMIVIGSPSSSNTQKLYEICKDNCQDTWCINTVNELNVEDLKNKEYVGITAGASTPDDLILQVIDLLKQYQDVEVL